MRSPARYMECGERVGDLKKEEKARIVTLKSKSELSREMKNELVLILNNTQHGCGLLSLHIQ